MNRLDNLIAHQLPGNASQIARRINRAHSSTLRALRRMVENGDVFRDEEGVYTWHPAKPLPPKPAVKLAEEEVWVKTFRRFHAEHQEEAQKQIHQLDHDTIVMEMSKPDNQLSVALFIELINAINEGQN